MPRRKQKAGGLFNSFTGELSKMVSAAQSAVGIQNTTTNGYGPTASAEPTASAAAPNAYAKAAAPNAYASEATQPMSSLPAPPSLASEPLEDSLNGSTKSTSGSMASLNPNNRSMQSGGRRTRGKRATRAKRSKRPTRAKRPTRSKRSKRRASKTSRRRA